MYSVFFKNNCGSQLYSYEKQRVIIFQMKTLTLVRCQRLSQHNFYQRQLFLSLTPGERMSDYKVVPLSNLLHLHSLQASSRKHFRDQLIFYIETLLLFFPIGTLCLQMQLSSGYPINSQRIAIDNFTSEYLSDPLILPLQVFEVQNASLNCFTEFRVCKNGLVLPNVHFSASCAELFAKYQHQQLIKRHRKRV